jgi:hypothetical protein
MYHGTVFLFYSTRVVSRYRLFFTECAVSLYKCLCHTDSHGVSCHTRTATGDSPFIAHVCPSPRASICERPARAAGGGHTHTRRHRDTHWRRAVSTEPDHSAFIVCDGVTRLVVWLTISFTLTLARSLAPAPVSLIRDMAILVGIWEPSCAAQSRPCGSRGGCTQRSPCLMASWELQS